MEQTRRIYRQRKRGINIKKKDKSIETLTIAEKIMLGALKCSEENQKTPFTFEELVLATWKIDKNTFGLRGFEENYPDSHKLHPNVFGGSALISQGYIKKKKNDLLYITDAGLARGLSISPLKINTPLRLNKQLQNFVLNMLSHPIFKKWIQDSANPKDFRGAGLFWGISPGTPPKTVNERISNIEKTLDNVLKFLHETKLEYVKEEKVRGKILFDKIDVERCLEFHNELKSRFKKELKILDPNGKY